jgi:1,2-phenylacetyl-CoA epoxidase catalytic subunit
MSDEVDRVWGDILSQAVTGELVGMLNYATLVELHESIDGKTEAVQHASRECAHAEAFRAAARELGIRVAADVDAPYWKRVRDAFVAHARAGDLVASIVIQEVMLESFAVASYRRLAEVAPEPLGRVFSGIATEEAEHAAHSIEWLRRKRSADPTGFDAKLALLNAEVMTTLAGMVARECRSDGCGLCAGSCVKPLLPGVGLEVSELRGPSLRCYLKALDAIGVPGETSLAWIARLPV